MVDMINQWSASFRFGLHLLPFRIGLESSPIFLRFLPAGMLQNVDEQVLRIRRILGRPVTNTLHVVSLEDRISVITKARFQRFQPLFGTSLWSYHLPTCAPPSTRSTSPVICLASVR